MPPIKDAIQKNAQRIAAGEQLVQPASKDVGPKSADGPFVSPASPVVTGLPVRGAYTPDITLHTDFQNNTGGFRSGPNMRSATFPAPQKTNSSIVSKIVTAATAAVSSLVIKVNNALAPNQKLINLLNGTGMVITVDASGNIVFNSTSSGDGLVHGTAPAVWESDPAYIILRDDFVGFHANGSVPTSGTIGQLGWAANQTGGTIRNEKLYSAGNWGWLSLFSTATAGVGASIVLDGADSSSNSSSIQGFPLAYTGGWDACFIFRYPKFASDVAANPATKLRLYIGFAEGLVANGSSATFTPRPAGFIGLRYDTDPNTWVLSAAATASGGTTVYTGTFTGATTNALYGQNFTVAGFVTHTSNNGTFKCVASTTTTITLVNASGVAESQAATATGTAFSDTTYKFEAVQNGSVGSNIQGTVVDSTISIDNNVHRFRMRSVTAGTILFSIDGGTESSITIGAQTVTASAASGEALIFTQGLATGGLQTTEITSNNLLIGAAVCPGTPVVIAGASGGALAAYNGTWNAIEYQPQSTGGNTAVWFDTSSLSPTAGGNSTTGSVKFYNSFSPYILMMSDSETVGNAVKVISIDFFSFVWNNGLGGTPGTPTVTDPRYW